MEARGFHGFDGDSRNVTSWLQFSAESLGQGQEVLGIGHASPSSSGIFLSFVAPRAWGGPLHAL